MDPQVSTSIPGPSSGQQHRAPDESASRGLTWLQLTGLLLLLRSGSREGRRAHPCRPSARGWARTGQSPRGQRLASLQQLLLFLLAEAWRHLTRQVAGHSWLLAAGRCALAIAAAGESAGGSTGPGTGRLGLAGTGLGRFWHCKDKMKRPQHFSNTS